jgi:hypothetical protein
MKKMRSTVYIQFWLAALVFIAANSNFYCKGQHARSLYLAVGYPRILADYRPLYTERVNGILPATTLTLNKNNLAFSFSFRLMSGWSIERDKPNTFSLAPNTVLSSSTILFQIATGKKIDIYQRFKVMPQTVYAFSFNSENVHTHYLLGESKSIYRADFPAVNVAAGCQLEYYLSQKIAIYSAAYQHFRIASITFVDVPKTGQRMLLFGEVGAKIKLWGDRE